MRNTIKAAVLAFAVLSTACDSDRIVQLTGTDSNSSQLVLEDGLVQIVRVTVMPGAPSNGTTRLAIESTITNTGTSHVRRLVHGCTLTVEADTPVSAPPDYAECLGLPADQELAPGDSVMATTQRVIHSASGRHKLRVQHAFDPDRWAAVTVTLHP